MGDCRREFTIDYDLIEKSKQKRELEYEDLFSRERYYKSKFPPEYSLLHVDFDPSSRKAKITFVERVRYRTIDRYVTRNYERRPEYSEWKSKTKEITRNIRLTNEALESLRTNPDRLIADFAYEIISALSSKELLPAWFIRRQFCETEENQVALLVQKKNELSQQCAADCRHLQAEIRSTEETQEQHILDLQYYEKVLNKYNAKIHKILRKRQNKAAFLLNILSLFIRCALLSERRLQTITSFRNSCFEECERLKQEIQCDEEKICQLKAEISDKMSELKEQCDVLDAEIEQTKNFWEQKRVGIPKLPADIAQDSNFFPLKSLSGRRYTKVIGCYVIHNTANNKYYVGQSKDVYKRLKQHFRGTVPQNWIFSEDYYQTDPSLREDLFEVKIVECDSKDMLDSTEKAMIEEYDSWNTGYNRTKGNS